MKKSLLMSAAVGVALALTLVVATAQFARTLATGAGGTHNVAVSSTNTYSIGVEEYESVALGVGFKGTGAATSTVQVFGYRSLDSTTYETTPFYSELLVLNGTTTTNTVIHLDVQGAAVVRLQIGNTNATVALTNLFIAARYKATKEAVFSTSR